MTFLCFLVFVVLFVLKWFAAVALTWLMVFTPLIVMLAWWFLCAIATALSLKFMADFTTKSKFRI